MWFMYEKMWIVLPLLGAWRDQILYESNVALCAMPCMARAWKDWCITTSTDVCRIWIVKPQMHSQLMTLKIMKYTHKNMILVEFVSHRPLLSVSAGFVRLNRLLQGCSLTNYRFLNVQLIRLCPVGVMTPGVSTKRDKHSLGLLGFDWKKLQLYGERKAIYPCVVTSA
jgi:hypothetical protein